MNLPPLPEHWMTASLLGANGSFQRAAREYAEEYARAYAEAAVLAERERCARVCDEAARSYQERGMDTAYAASKWIAAAIRTATP